MPNLNAAIAAIAAINPQLGDSPIFRLLNMAEKQGAKHMGDDKEA